MKKIILIGGGSCSGKTTLAKTIQKILGVEKSFIISQDDYFIDYSNLSDRELSDENFDQPSAFKLQEMENDILSILKDGDVKIPKYNFEKHVADSFNICRKEIPYLIIEGLFGLYIPSINKLASLRLFIDTAPDIMLLRRIRRDQTERFFTVDSTLNRYESTVRIGFYKYVYPTQDCAHEIINGNLHFNSVAISDILRQYRLLV